MSVIFPFKQARKYKSKLVNSVLIWFDRVFEVISFLN
jgi:hypothetical protein